MPKIEDRVTSLEARMERAEAVSAQASEVALLAQRTAAAALEAHRRNVDMLQALQVTQSEHTRRFDVIDQRFDAVDRRFDAVDGRLDAADRNFDTIHGQLGQLTLAAHSIQSMLTTLVEREDDDHEEQKGAGSS